MNWFRRNPKPDWMQTFSGVQYRPAAPRVEDVRIIDIAHHLSMLCRFTGAVRQFYSVAEHSVLVSRIVPPEHALCGLLHDATEAYTNDINKPLKRSLPDYQEIEALNWAVIADKFGLPREIPAEVHEADYAMLRAEQVRLMPYCEHTEAWARDAHPNIAIRGLAPTDAEARFLERFYELTRGRALPARPPRNPRPILSGKALIDSIPIPHPA